MKKGLLSILAGALVVVGCQNYDDQFDNLESQISALASTVAGLSQVQSDLTSLAGTVSSLASTVNGLGSQIDTAVADGLADIQADIEAIETAVGDVASSEEVSALSDAVAASQEDLDELLANSSVFTGSVVVNSVATLDAFHAMGSSLAIVNGSVNIDVNTEMDMVKVQELVDQILTVTGDFEYHAAASTIAEVTFNNLTGVQTLTLEQPGGYVFQELVSASKISLSDKYKSSVDIIDFRSLTSVSSFGTDAYTGGAITFDKADEIHLTSLPYYAPGTLSLTGKKGGVIDISALDDVNSAGDQTSLNLSLKGPDSVTISNLDGKGGSITLEDVENATINDFDGTITIKDGVENFTSNNVVAFGSASTWTDIVSVDITGVVDPNFIASTATPKDYGPAVTFNALSDLEEITLAGTFDKVAVTANTSLITAIVSADVTGTGGIDFDGNTDLETLTLTGSKAAKVSVDDNDSLTSLTIDTTIQASSAKLATKDGSISVDGNKDLESLVIGSTDITTLTVTNNPALTSIDGTLLTKLGAGGTTAAPITPAVNIYANDLSATLATDKTNATGCTDCDALEENDLGSFTTSSKMETLAPYLKLVEGNAKSQASVYFDTVESTVDNAGTETAAEATGKVDGTLILELVAGKAAVYTGAGDAIYPTKAYLIDMDDNSVSGLITITLDGQDILHDGSAYVTALDITQGSQLVSISELINNESTSRASLLGATFNVKKGGNAEMPTVTFASRVSSTSNGEAYTNNAALNLIGATAALGVDTSLTTWDKVTLTIGGLSVTKTVSAWKTGSAAAYAIADALGTEWGAKFGATAGTSSNLSVWGDITHANNSAALSGLALKASDAGSRGFLTQNTIGVSVAYGTAAQISAATAGAKTQSVLDWTIGSDGTTDNVSTSPDLILTIAGSADNDLSNFVITDGDMDGTGIVTLTSEMYTLTNNGAGTKTSTAQNIYPLDARNDVVNAEAASEGILKTAAVTAVDKTRVHWLGN